MELSLPLPINLPPRLLRLILGCIALGFLLVSTSLLVRPWYRQPQTAAEFFALANTTIEPGEKSIWAPWTTEQPVPSFAYAQYATNLNYLCNAVINFRLLKRYGAQHDLVLIHPKQWSEGNSPEARALATVRKNHPEIILSGFDVVSTRKGDATWADSLTKFHSFALTNWTRVLAFDSDSLVLNKMDHYFLSPLAALAVPRAYWLTKKEDNLAQQVLGSHVMLLEPNEKQYNKIMDEALKSGDFDMEVINHMFKDSAMILPHRRLALLSGEFRSNDHSKYLAPNDDEEWNAMGEVSRSVLVHFSDWPLPKPWLPRTEAQWQQALPECREDDVGTADRPPCDNRMMWTGFYRDYDMYKEKFCVGIF
ncbi:Glucose N-acetyltransferase 1 [Paramyrothecium foliicola]|nr:Glucose N-acetyltransferase 1 [Paramyrothecium foliicola]